MKQVGGLLFAAGSGVS